jgi:DNA-binding HxlR family transcriptional regulator
MLRRTYDDQVCSIARALEVVGERWTFLIIRDALLGVSRFDGFLDSLGIARNVLTDRLNALVANGIFDRIAYQQRPTRHEYHLTPKGRDLVPVIVTLMEWGDRHFSGKGGPPRQTVHTDCGGRVTSLLLCATCDRPVEPAEVTSRMNRRRSR